MDSLWILVGNLETYLSYHNCFSLSFWNSLCIFIHLATLKYARTSSVLLLSYIPNLYHLYNLLDSNALALKLESFFYKKTILFIDIFYLFVHMLIPNFHLLLFYIIILIILFFHFFRLFIIFYEFCTDILYKYYALFSIVNW